MCVMRQCLGCGDRHHLCCFSFLFFLHKLLWAENLKLCFKRSFQFISMATLRKWLHKACWVMLSDDWCRKNKRVSKKVRSSRVLAGFHCLDSTLQPLSWNTQLVQTFYLLEKMFKWLFGEGAWRHNWYDPFLKDEFFLQLKDLIHMLLCLNEIVRNST